MNNFINNTNVNSVLLDAINLGIINLDSVAEITMKKKYESLIKNHEYKITPPKQEGGRWQTYYKKEGKKICIKANTEEKLKNKLVGYYKELEEKNKITFNSLFQEWLAYKEHLTTSNNTLLRYKQEYNRFFNKNILSTMSIHKIDTLLLEQESNRIIKENNLSRKSWNNVKVILNGMFSYAKRKGYLDSNLIEDVQILVKFKQVNKKSSETQTYNTKELADLNKYLDRKYSETGDLGYLAVKLNFLLGLRVGELVALKWEDYEFSRLHIIREEVKDREHNKYYVENHTKTNTDRFVTLVPKAIKILQDIKDSNSSGFIFTRDGNRITSRQIAYILEKYAKENGTIVKSTHKMRKTYASKLSANNVPIDYIREQLGHSSLKTTYEYIYNPLTEKETYNLLSKAL